MYIALKCLLNELLAITSLQKPLLHLILIITAALKPVLPMAMALLPGNPALTIQGTFSPQKGLWIRTTLDHSSLTSAFLASIFH